jgi:pectinesterase
VIFRESFLDSIVNFTGWVEWEGRGPIPETVLYLEYDNYGPGADTSRRINIVTAVRIVTDCHEAAQYTADPFVDANFWMPKDKEGRDIIPYARGLSRDPTACPPATRA